MEDPKSPSFDLPVLNGMDRSVWRLSASELVSASVNTETGLVTCVTADGRVLGEGDPGFGACMADVLRSAANWPTRK